MLRMSSFVVLAAACALAACQPQKTPEQIAAENMQKLATQMAGALSGQNGQLNPADTQAAAQAMSAAIAAGVNAGVNDPNMTAEDRAKAQAIAGAISSGNVDPAASGYLAGMQKAAALIGAVKDDASLAAAQSQLPPIYAQMKPFADQLNAMTKDQRDVAMGSAAAQIMSVAMTMGTSLMPLSMSNPTLAGKAGKLMDGMPELKD